MHTTTHQKGSLLIETLVAFAILSLVITSVVGSFTLFQRANRASLDDLETLQSLMFALDDITREFQLSDVVACHGGQSADKCGSGIQLKRQAGLNSLAADDVLFQYDSAQEQITKQVGTGGVDPITPSDVSVQRFDIYLYGEAVGDSEPTRILMVLQAKKDGATGAPVRLQTTITSRLTDQ